ncbi:MAG: metallophosphoesterase [Acidobacteriota bacterium]
MTEKSKSGNNMKKVNRRKFLRMASGGAGLLVGGCTGNWLNAEQQTAQPCTLRNSSPDLCFTFLGDLHYAIPEYKVGNYFVEPFADELKKMDLPPDFVLHSGDFFHTGQGSDVETEASYSFDHFSRTIPVPFFMARGNHDSKTPYEKNALPIFSRQLGRPITTSYYAFDRGNCRFIILDCMANELSGQLTWLEEELKSCDAREEIEHVFVCGHYPLWIVARVGFERPDYSESVASLLVRYNADAYLCGHTHNISTTVKLVNGKPLTQIMGAAVVEEGRLDVLAPFVKRVQPAAPANIFRPGLMPLQEASRIYIDPAQLVYCWGYMEGSTSSYYVFTVSADKVHVDLHVLGEGVVRSFMWEKPGHLVDIKEPKHQKGKQIKSIKPGQIKKAWLYVAPWTNEESVSTPLSVNGVPAGTVKINGRYVSYSPFWNRVEVPLSEAAVAALKKENILCFHNPAKNEFGLAHIFLLAQLRSGRYTKSDIGSSVLTSFRPTTRGHNFPDSRFILPVDKGQNLQEVTLKFNRIFQIDSVK